MLLILFFFQVILAHTDMDCMVDIGEKSNAISRLILNQLCESNLFNKRVHY